MYVVIACNGPKLLKRTNTDNTATNTDLMVIRYYKCSSDRIDVFRVSIGPMQHVITVKCSTYIV